MAADHAYVADLNVGVLYLTSIALHRGVWHRAGGLNWLNNKYAMLGGIRSSAQMISYELSLGLCIVIATSLPR
ncbi:MAG: NADH-quinone oxidoreductase subunit H [Anaerolineales bacterium]|nr:NADH-quinone oxidoreductase subunit H [Anaerolineales bacterium]